MSINVCTFEGKLTGDPIQRFTINGKQVVDFDIAVPKKFKKEGGPTADFFKCEAWERNAELIYKHFRKGDSIIVTGEMENNNYTNRDGQKIYGVVLKVRDWSFGPKKLGREGTTPGYNQGNSYQGDYGNGGYGGYQSRPSVDPGDGFMTIPDGLEEELPFN